MAGFNQMLLAGNPWPIGAITHLLTEAQGNYELPKYTHDTRALDCMVLMELGQETVVCGFISQFQPLPSPCHISLIVQDRSRDREIVSSNIIIFIQYTDIWLSRLLHPTTSPENYYIHPDFANSTKPSSVVGQVTSYQSPIQHLVLILGRIN